MRHLLIALGILVYAGANQTMAQPDTTNIAMNTTMAFNQKGNASLANISMWPNPAANSVNIYINSIRPGDRGEVTMLNAAGTRCVGTYVRNGTNNIYFGTLPEGTYFLNIRLHNVVLTKKLVVRR